MNAHSQPRIAPLDGLRGFAVLSIVFLHWIIIHHQTELSQEHPFFFQIGGLGTYGVDLFFVLSGFLIGSILITHRNSSSVLKAFYIRRALRILPIYLLLIALIFIPLFGHRHADLGDVPLIAYLTFTQNLFTAFDYTRAPWAGVLWSLAIEEQFYLVIPLLILYLSRKSIITILSFCLILSPCLRWMGYTGLFEYDPYHFTLCQIDGLAIGVLGAYINSQKTLLAFLKTRRPFHRNFIIASGISFFLVHLALPSSPEQVQLSQTLGKSVANFFFLSIILYVVWHPESFTSKSFQFQPLQTLGKYSYFIYLFHTPIHTTLQNLALSEITLPLLSIFFLGLTAVLSWRYIENPCIQYGKQFYYSHNSS